MNVSVAAIAIEGGKYFIAKRKSGGSMSGKWEFPGGKCEDGETKIQALLREIKEEFDVEITVGKKLAEGNFENKGVKHHLEAYAVSFLSTDFKLVEHTEYAWATALEIECLDFTPSDLDLLRSIEACAE
ncbi:MAG: (deoxy)nucleoside triphosphate pyrophosphohydrolase [Termitinemataceae bacterium]|nr:MAG: (deoxy)nucleoside triphosphate pyrophosphohydrolase [Termitinemataceae bacterium]